ncbi:small ribosomal subunit protein bS16m-like [Rhopilema esculentum]|uniref:small ribosomal subunit protein bS16m-like n=1 Tax=Rhopilema esculentum TaxID=499914 RepID=UPI0031D93416|eukprot:gene16850-8325_t
MSGMPKTWFWKKSFYTLRLQYHGCTNRPFFHIVATKRRIARDRGYNEQVGTYDPLPNTRNEKLVSLNMDRIKYWLAQGAEPSRPVQELFALAGIYPIRGTLVRNAERKKASQLKCSESSSEQETES